MHKHLMFEIKKNTIAVTTANKMYFTYMNVLSAIIYISKDAY